MYDDDVASKMIKMAEKTSVQMKERTLSGEARVSTIAFLQDSKAACDAYNIYESATMWLFTHYLSSPAEAVIN